MESVVAEKYAMALLQVAREKKAEEALGEEISSLKALVRSRPALKAVLEHPRGKAEEKIEALQALWGRKLSATMENFLLLLILKKRIRHLGEVADLYERYLFQIKGKALARVLSPSPLQASQRRELSEKLSGTFGVEVELREEVKPGLIGGIMVYLGDQRMDASVLGRLEKMKQKLLKSWGD
jgi:F-type H+-transporting ATPase subunit delta